MKYYVMVLDDNPIMLEKSQAGWKKYMIAVHSVRDVQSAVIELRGNAYALITLMADYLSGSLLDAIRFMRDVSTVPILAPLSAACALLSTLAAWMA